MADPISILTAFGPALFSVGFKLVSGGIKAMYKHSQSKKKSHYIEQYDYPIFYNDYTFYTPYTMEELYFPMTTTMYFPDD